MLAEIVEHAVPLRTGGLLAAWQRALTHYPEEVQQRLIASAIVDWSFPHILAARQAAARRGDRHRLARLLVRDVDNVLRLIFALNSQWEPEWKWLGQHTASLRIKPGRLIERIDAIFATAEPERSVALCQRLIADTLALVSPPHDVGRVRALVEHALRAPATATDQDHG